MTYAVRDGIGAIGETGLPCFTGFVHNFDGQDFQVQLIGLGVSTSVASGFSLCFL